jgi:hypothetical protein
MDVNQFQTAFGEQVLPPWNHSIGKMSSAYLSSSDSTAVAKSVNEMSVTVFAAQGCVKSTGMSYSGLEVLCLLSPSRQIP